MQAIMYQQRSEEEKGKATANFRVDSISENMRHFCLSCEFIPYVVDAPYNFCPKVSKASTREDI